MCEGSCSADVIHGDARWHVAHCDNLFALQGMPDCCVDAVVCDPPYELAFMGRRWDASGVAYDVERWREVLRVLKPGGHLLAFGGTRTYHRMTCAIEDAGLDIRDSLHWFYASGFPKSLDVSKAIDAHNGDERPVIGTRPVTREFRGRDHVGDVSHATTIDVSSAASAASAAWSGWGTALKPAHEPIVVARKPITGTVAANVLAHGTGAINVDGCRVATDDDLNGESYGNTVRERDSFFTGKKPGGAGVFVQPSGRWPANILFSHAPTCTETTCDPACPVAELDRQSGDRPGMSGGGNHRPDYAGGMFGGIDCSHTARGDNGGASRFFYCFRFEAKASTVEREAGLDDLPLRTAGELTGRKDGSAGLTPRAGAGRASNGRRNAHPTVKPVALMRWLCKLVTPPGGIVLDIYAGSGTTGIGAVLEGFRFVGIEGEAMCGGFGEERSPHVEIARARIRHRIGGTYDIKRDEPANDAAPRQGSLFG